MDHVNLLIFRSVELLLMEFLKSNISTCIQCAQNGLKQKLKMKILKEKYKYKLKLKIYIKINYY